MTTFSISQRMDELDAAKMLEDDRVPEAINEILRAMAIDEHTRPLSGQNVLWIKCTPV